MQPMDRIRPMRLPWEFKQTRERNVIY